MPLNHRHWLIMIVIILIKLDIGHRFIGRFELFSQFKLITNQFEYVLPLNRFNQ